MKTAKWQDGKSEWAGSWLAACLLVEGNVWAAS